MAKKKSVRSKVMAEPTMPTSNIGFVTLPIEMDNKNKYMGLVCLVLIIAILVIYMQVRNHEFLNYDDDAYITNNSHVISGLTGKNVVWAFTSVDATTGNWHPITWLSHMADVQLYGMNPCGHHITNVVIHIASSLLLLILLSRFTGSLWQSSFVAALFALHPLHVESVAWAAERKDVLSGFLGLLSLLIYSEYVAKQKPTLYLLSLFSFVLGLMSKPMLVTLPIVMLLIDFWPLGRYRHEGQEQGLPQLLGRVTPFIKEKIPFFACSLLSAVVTIYAQNKGGAIRNFDVVPFGFRIENALISYVKYIDKTLWPHDLAVLYPLPLSFPLWQVIGSLCVLLLLSAVTIWTGRRHPYIAVGWFWFLITLLPVIGLIQVGSQSMADRYSYIPAIGLFIMAAWGVPNLTKGLPYRQGILSLLASGVIIALAALTWVQLGYWQDNFSLYRHTLQVTTSNSVIHNNLGIALAKRGDLDTAIHEYKEAIRINPNYSYTHYCLGLALDQKGDQYGAIKEFQEVLKTDFFDRKTHGSLGVAYGNIGQLDAAIREFKVALMLSPGNKNLLSNLGVALALKNKQVQSR